MMGLVL